MTSSSPGYLIKDLCFSYGQIHCISNVTLHLKPGILYGLIGPNGSGKSTLLDLISGHSIPDTGTLFLHEKALAQYSRKELAKIITAVPQSFTLNFDYSVEEVVLMGRYPHIPRFGRPAPSDLHMVETAMDLMGIDHLKHRKVTHLSGGEKQRVMIARSLAQDADIVLLDEVTANLDINHAITIMKTMSDLVHAQKRMVIAALHDLNMAATFCDYLIVMKNGSLLTSGPTEEILSEELIMDLYHVPSTIYKEGLNSRHIRFNYQ